MAYNVKFTDSNKAAISVPETGINEDYSIKFPGRIRLEWGKDINENLIHLLENFACPALDVDIDSPDPAISGGILDNPVDGQFWYNTTNKTLYKYVSTFSSWKPLAKQRQMYAANWGQVMHGQTLPNPVDQNGKLFPYSECIWSVSPHNYLDGFTSMVCTSDPITSVVTMQYVSKSSGITIDGIANYLIIGISRNSNLG